MQYDKHQTKVVVKLSCVFLDIKNSVSHTIFLGNHAMAEIIYNLALTADASLEVKSPPLHIANSSAL